jgi:hypothetical protein
MDVINEERSSVAIIGKRDLEEVAESIIKSNNSISL